MPELIDRQALIADYRICGGCSNFENCKGYVTMCDSARIRQAINEAPAIEAEPVRRGHWVLTRDEQYEYCHCSECGYDTGENWMIGSEIPYCSQCGSKNYDGGADNDSE